MSNKNLAKKVTPEQDERSILTKLQDLDSVSSKLSNKSQELVNRFDNNDFEGSSSTCDVPNIDEIIKSISLHLDSISDNLGIATKKIFGE